MTASPRPGSPGFSRAERLAPRDDDRRAALAAWRASDDGAGFVAALRARGLDLADGRKRPVIVDGSGAAHLATRVLSAASRRLDGERISAAVHVRLAGRPPENLGEYHGPALTLAAVSAAGAVASSTSAVAIVRQAGCSTDGPAAGATVCCQIRKSVPVRLPPMA